MKKQCLSLIVVSALLLGLLLTGCGQPEKKTEELPAGLHLVVEGLPEIESFSGREYEPAFDSYTKVTGAVLYRSGEKTPLEPTDERVIRLMNFIDYSRKEFNSYVLQGTVDENTIDAWYCFDNMLEITLETPETSFYAGVVLVSGNSYLTLLKRKGETGGRVAGRYYPYMSLFRETKKTSGWPDQFSCETSGTMPWIDLLQYAGIIEAE